MERIHGKPMTDKEPKMKRVTVTMPPHVAEALKRAQEGGFYKISFSAIVTKACEEHLQSRGYLPKEEIEELTNP